MTGTVGASSGGFTTVQASGTLMFVLNIQDRCDIQQHQQTPVNWPGISQQVSGEISTGQSMAATPSSQPWISKPHTQEQASLKDQTVEVIWCHSVFIKYHQSATNLRAPTLRTHVLTTSMFRVTIWWNFSRLLFYTGGMATSAVLHHNRWHHCKHDRASTHQE